MTPNQLIRDYLSRVTGQLEPAAAEFAEVARARGGHSDGKTPWSRAALHARPGQLYGTVRVENPFASRTTKPGSS